VTLDIAHLDHLHAAWRAAVDHLATAATAGEKAVRLVAVQQTRDRLERALVASWPILSAELHAGRMAFDGAAKVDPMRP
jgi:hypothetical protein